MGLLEIITGTREQVSIKGKTNNELVAEIHETFNTEVDRLLADAGILRPIPKHDKGAIDKGIRLSRLGFAKSKDAEKGRSEKAVVRNTEKENEEKSKLKEAILYFKNKYPNYKFITEDSVKKICGKYNLIYGSVENYVGDVPEDNLLEMEKFSIDEKDDCFIKNSSYRTFSQDYVLNYSQMRTEKEWTYKSSIIDDTFFKAPLEIAAPLKDFDTTDMDVEDFKLSKIEILDPVVLQPVMYGVEKYYLIVTAWGEEAEDELVK